MLPDMKNRFIYALGFCAAILASCGEMDEIHRDFYEDGEIIYPGKADSLKAYPGRYRLGLSWLILADPKATRAKIFWNNRQDSLEMDMVRTSHTDTVRSEEHTSELQSLMRISYAVFCLKKKNLKNKTN